MSLEKIQQTIDKYDIEDIFDIDVAIAHAKEKAKELAECECGVWHSQLAVWLEELKDRRKGE